MASSRNIGSLSVDLIAKTAGFTAGMDKAARDADKSMSKIEKRAYQFGSALGKGIKLAAVGFAAATTAVAALTAESINYADELQDLSGKLGISTEQLSKWAYVANLSGTDIDTVARSVNLLGKNLAAAADPTSNMGELFASLGIQVKDAAGNLRSAEDVLPEIADRFKALDNQTTETALAMQLFGKSGAELLEFLNRGSDGIKTLEDELASLGGVISSDTARAAEQFKDELGKLKIVGQGLGLQIAQQLLPTLIETAEDLRVLVKEGNLASNAVTVLSSAMRAGVFILEQYDNAVERASIAIEGFVNLQRGVAEIAMNLGPAGLFNEGSILGGIRRITNGYEEAQAQLDDLVKRQKQAAPENFSGVIGGVTTQDERAAAASKDAEAKRLQERIDRLMSGGASGKSSKDAQKEAESLTRAYDSLALSLDRQIALFGETTEAAKVRYEVEFGDLVNLDPKLKQYLIYKAEELDLARELSEQAKEEERLQEDENKRLEDGLKYGREVTAGLKFEVELLGMSNREREKAIALSRLSAEARIAEGAAISASIDELYADMERVELMDGFRDSFQNFFTDVLTGTQSVSDAFKSMLDDINAMILNRIAENWVDQLFGAMGSTQGGAAGGNWFSMIAGLFGGGMATGGMARPNTLYEVNERGLEMATVNGRDYMLTGNSPVQVTPSHKLGGGVQQSNTFVIQGRIDRRTQDQIVQDVGRKTQTAMARNG